MRAELGQFTGWLEREGVDGYVGEVGWPDQQHGGEAQRWNALGETWYEDADAAGLWVTQWSTGEWWGRGYKLAVYEDREPGDGIESANTQAEVLEAHPTTPQYLRGVNVSGAEFGTPPALAPTSGFSNRRLGRYGTAYHYDRADSFRYLASRGVRLIRLQFRWERLQPRLLGPLRARGVKRLAGAVSRAEAAGLEVILDVHNYGDYYLERGGGGVRATLGSKRLPAGTLADLWRRISARFETAPGVVGYGLANEPAGMRGRGGLRPAEVWERASQRAVDAIRGRGDDQLIVVQGYSYAAAQRWPQIHPDAWIDDPLRRIRYEAHHYWDRENSGAYEHSYAEEVADAERRGY